MTPPELCRRRFCVASSAALAWSGVVMARPEDAPSGSAGLIETRNSPHARVRSVGMGESRWTAGFWADQFRTCVDRTLPHLDRIMGGTEPSQFLENFRVAAGERSGKHRGPGWNDGDTLKWVEAASAVLALTRDARLDRRLDEIIAVIVRAQDPDGYLHTPVQIRRRAGDVTAVPFGDRLDFETYNLGHLITAGCVHHRATGKTTLLDAAVRAAGFLSRAVRDQTEQLARTAVCPSHYMAVVELYRTTRDPAHLRLAEDLIALRDRVGVGADLGSDDNQDRIPFRQQRTAVGHAVRANYLYAGVADLVLETGDRSWLDPLLAIWDDVVGRKLSLTGGCGALYDGASPDGSKDQKTITRTHQSYGRPYQLPQSTAHNETCAAIGHVLWNARMLALTGEARFADLVEHTLFNAVLAGVSRDGTRFFYTNTLRQLDAMPVDLRWSRERQPFISCFCCPPNVARTVAEVASYAYGRSEGSIWVHLYGAGELATEVAPGRPFRLRQETDYPWDGRVTIRVDEAPAEPVTLRLRIPGWAAGATLDAPAEVRPGAYAAVTRVWRAGDALTLRLPMPVRCLEAHPLVEEARNQVAYQRGPIVYCLESSDLPAGVSLLDVHAVAPAELTPHREPVGEGPPLVVLRGEWEAEADSAPWSGSLYRDRGQRANRPIPVRLIPYFAWGNRGRSEMSVWVPLAAR